MFWFFFCGTKRSFLWGAIKNLLWQLVTFRSVVGPPPSFQDTFQRANCTEKSLWWLFGDQQTKSSITVSWIRAKQRKSTVKILTKCTKNFLVNNSQRWSAERSQFCSMTVYVAQMTLQKLNELPDSSSDYHFFSNLDIFVYDKNTSNAFIVLFFWGSDFD